MAQSKLETVFALLDALGWGLPERERYRVVLTPALLGILTAERDGLRRCVDEDEHADGGATWFQRCDVAQVRVLDEILG